MEIIFIVLLSCALVASLLFLWLYRKAFWVLYQKMANQQKELNKYECMLLLNIFYNYDFEGRAVDFSRYETQGLIVYNCFHDAKNSPKGIANDGIVSSFYKQAFVYELDDGTFEWEDAEPAF